MKFISETLCIIYRVSYKFIAHCLPFIIAQVPRGEISIYFYIYSAIYLSIYFYIYSAIYLSIYGFLLINNTRTSHNYQNNKIKNLSSMAKIWILWLFWLLWVNDWILLKYRTFMINKKLMEKRNNKTEKK